MPDKIIRFEMHMCGFTILYGSHDNVRCEGFIYMCGCGLCGVIYFNNRIPVF